MIIGAVQAGEYARKGEHPVPSIDVHPAAGLTALNIMVAHFTSYNKCSMQCGCMCALALVR